MSADRPEAVPGMTSVGPCLGGARFPTSRAWCVIIALATALYAGVSQAERTIADSVYTKAQARSGKKLYGKHCIACHERGYFREVLRARRGETLDSIFEVMVTEMPMNNPGSLSDNEYLDVLAYMLAQSRFACGDTPLLVGELGKITISPGG